MKTKSDWMRLSAICCFGTVVGIVVSNMLTNDYSELLEIAAQAVEVAKDTAEQRDECYRIFLPELYGEVQHE